MCCFPGQDHKLMLHNRKSAVVLLKVRAGPERSIVCTETTSSSGSQRSCVAIGQRWKEGGGPSSRLLNLPASPIPSPRPSCCLPSERTGRCGDNRTQSRRRMQGCSAPHPPSHGCTEARGGAFTPLPASPGPSMRPGASPVLSRADSAADSCDWEPSGG